MSNHAAGGKRGPRNTNSETSSRVRLLQRRREGCEASLVGDSGASEFRCGDTEVHRTVPCSQKAELTWSGDSVGEIAEHSDTKRRLHGLAQPAKGSVVGICSGRGVGQPSAKGELTEGSTEYGARLMLPASL